MALLLVVALAAPGLIVGCPAAPAREEAPRPAPKRLVVALTAEPDTLSPLLAETGAAHEVIALFARDLVWNDASWQAVPDLAASIPTLENGGARLTPEGGADGAGGGGGKKRLVVEWKIRPDARWEDGAPVVWEDFLLAWRVQSDPAQEIVLGRDNAERIESMAPIPGGFVVTWREPYPFFADPRVHRALPSHALGPRLVDKERLEGERLRPLKDDPEARRPLANGPFRLVEHAPGQHLLLRRNPHYTPAPLLEEVLVKLVPSTTAALTLLQSGGAHAVFPAGGPSPIEARRFVARHAERFALASAPGQVWTHIDINLDDPWLKDVRLRRALAAAIPRRQIFEALSGGLYETAETYLPPRHWGHAQLPPLAWDPEAARALLDEAGWSAVGADGVRKNAKGERLSLVLSAASGQPEAEELLQLVRKSLLEVGVEVTLDLRPFKVFFGEGARKRKLPHLAFYAWTLDGTSMGTALWREDRIPTADNGWKGQNLPGWRNAEATALLREADGTLALEERRRLLRRVQELVREELPAIPMYFRPVVVVHDRRVRGLLPTGTQTPLGWNAAAWDLQDPERPR
jgi:peptide/nickel transport system substrate-binding protein